MNNVPPLNLHNYNNFWKWYEMSKSFSQIKSPQVQITDVLTFGKFQGSRVCDILEDNYEYVLWLNSKMPQYFSKYVIDECNIFKQKLVVAEEEENNKAILNMNPWAFSDMEDDIPF